MSSSEAHSKRHGQDDRHVRPNRRSLLLGLCGVIAATPLITACGGNGFRPLYGSLGSSSQVDRKLASVEITTIPGRTGQLIRNELLFQTTGGGQPLPPAYRLEITIRESTTTALVAADGNSASQIYQVDANFRLIDLASKASLVQGTSYGRASFDRVTAIFANVRASQDARNRAAKTIATDIKSRLAAFLASLPA